MSPGRDRRGRRLRRRQRSLLPQPVDGGVQGHARCRLRSARQHGDRDGAQRRRVRDPPERHRRRLVHRTRAGGRGPAVPRLHQLQAPDLGDSATTGDLAGLGGFGDGGLARRAVRRRLAPGRDREQPGALHHRRWAQWRLHPAGARLHRHARRHRRPQGGRQRHRADHQHRHRAQAGRHRPDRPGSPARRSPASPRRSALFAEQVEAA